MKIVLKIAIQCVQNDREDRPEMTEVIKQLEFAKLVADEEESTASPVSSGIASSSTYRPSRDMASTSSSHIKSAGCEIVSDDEE